MRGAPRPGSIEEHGGDNQGHRERGGSGEGGGAGRETDCGGGEMTTVKGLSGVKPESKQVCHTR